MVPVTLRLATSHDDTALERLAGLDSRPLPPGPHLVAEREGRIDAALSLSTRVVLADPFRPTAGLCDVLRCHAGGLPRVAEHRQSGALQPHPRLVAA